MAKKDDLRRHPRVEARLAMQLAEESLGDALVTTESLNISRGGVYCESAEFLAPLSRVALTVVLPPFGAGARSRVLKSEGVVVRCESMAPLKGRKRYQLACCFTGLDADMRALLDAFVTWRATRRAIPAPARPAPAAPRKKAGVRRLPAKKKAVAKKAAPKKAAARKAAPKKAAKKKVAARKAPPKKVARPKARGRR